jgi:hypothetical protein
MSEPKMVNLYLSTFPSCRYIYKDGTEAVFVNGKYATGEQNRIEELDAEVAARHPYIFTDKDKLQIDEKELDPMEALKKKIIAEAIASGEVVSSSSSSDQSPVKPSSVAALSGLVKPSISK